jgi:hypothetical protein
MYERIVEDEAIVVPDEPATKGRAIDNETHDEEHHGYCGKPSRLAESERTSSPDPPKC